MAKVLIVYGSTTGNTQRVAEMIAAYLVEKQHEGEVKNVVRALPDELGNGYDLTLLGSSTWGEDEIEFQDDFDPFYRELDTAKQLQGKKVALFGCGDSSFIHFCGAVDLLELKMEDLDADVIGESLRIDGDPEEAAEEIAAWAEMVERSIRP
ncbi:flavodoxin [Desulfofustis glycolicus]|uniref:Flavodoxin n=1 Tax=Desulfofustis glycolicus DSM 9705 TaxID=1121409 RepID=A0A1M5YSD7_9BACT|nr:flavodoxin [Desulfofustis glycolicus]MCB2218419.1 flavodoxin [Desulfobulbaceae bacterium]SHI14849.1 flavodoxin, short chain [Desulfofustis glycolicus DSM 9705]